MAYIKINTKTPVYDGMPITFKAPCDCSLADGLSVNSTIFEFKDAHGVAVAGIENLFKSGSLVKVILDVTHGSAYIQNADTNSYVEGHLSEAKMLPGEEYNTGELYNGEPVYTRVIEVDSLPNDGSMTVLPYFKGFGTLVSLSGVVCGEGGNTAVYSQMPYINNLTGAVMAVCYWITDPDNLYNGANGLNVTTFSNMTAYKARFVLKYTKTPTVSDVWYFKKTLSGNAKFTAEIKNGFCVGYDTTVYRHVSANGNAIAVSADGESYVNIYSNGWISEINRTWFFSSKETSVSSDFYAWLIENATKV